jgi:hypothetical protein
MHYNHSNVSAIWDELIKKTLNMFAYLPYLPKTYRPMYMCPF